MSENQKKNNETKPPKYFVKDSKKISADAPYNFISLPTDICVPGIIWEDIVATKDPVMCENEKGEQEVDDKATKKAIKNIFEKYETYIQIYGKHSGYIDLEITTKQETLVGMPGKTDKESTFFSIKNNEPMIPGSSLRGMTRNLFKIMTASSFRTNEDFNNRVLYYRDITGGNGYDELKKEYSNNHYNDDENNIYAGFIVRVKDETGKSQWYIQRDTKIELKGERKSGAVEFPQIDWSKFKEDLSCTILVNIVGKKNVTNLYSFTWEKDCESKEYRVDDEIIQNYLNDEKRGTNSINLLYARDCKDAKKVPGGAYVSPDLSEIIGIPRADLIAPCFFVVDEKCDRVKHFGHTKFYRIPYLNSIEDHVPSTLRTKRVDFTDLVFGLKEFWGGRIYFGDAKYIDTDKEPIYKKESRESILLGANPTSFQMYLKQDEDSRRVHWNYSKSTIRGVKYYWQRRNIHEYHANNDDNTMVKSSLSNIVNSGVTFKGKVYFKDLTDLELGALCKVLFAGTGKSTGNNWRHVGRRFKIGKGKSMGLGTIQIKSVLYLDKDDLYQNESMWSEDGILPTVKEGCSEKYNVEIVDSFIGMFEAHARTSMDNHFESLRVSVDHLYYMMDSGGFNDEIENRIVHMGVEEKDDPYKRFVCRTALLEPKEFKTLNK